MAAERGAHHHSFENAKTDDSKPDIFTVVAQEGLKGILQPAFCHVCKVLGEQYPDRLSWLYRRRDEVYLLFDLLLEYQSLTKLNGSFAESFYGMKRVSECGLSPHRLRLHGLAILTLFPYVRRKAESLYEALAIRLADQEIQGKNLQHTLMRAYVRLYPYLHTAWEGLLLIYYLRYLFGTSNCHSPLLALSRVSLRLKGIDDQQVEQSYGWIDILYQGSITDKTRLLVQKLSSDMPELILQGFSTGVFFLQFMQWYNNYQQNNVSHTAINVAKAIPPPQKPEFSRNPLVCPICNKTRTNSTVVSTSGFVYCYPCIYRYIQQHNRCPVSGFKANLQHLVKLYPPGD